jgi:3-methyladenine DNA glycosylase AlkD
MNKTEAMQQLRALGTAQNRKVYARHGVGGPSFGVSYANLGKLKKSIRVDHELARELWASGNHDARVLATMIADPGQITARDLDTWVEELDSHPLTDAFSGLAASSALASKRVAKWIGSKKEWVSTAGWSLVARLAMTEGALSDSACEGHLKTIESKIHGAPNRTRYAMNGALIAIGMRNAALGKKATAAARSIGPVEVDHGETGCKTPDAATYIQKAAARKPR